MNLAVSLFFFVNAVIQKTKPSLHSNLGLITSFQPLIKAPKIGINVGLFAVFIAFFIGTVGKKDKKTALNLALFY
ncbi:hypothetical protein ACKC10_003008 [Proteus mirabilis]|uniref:hypothetical protein n=1 Tax=Proteus mirabilis TaxID=584 RepID=UPI001F6002FF|nr:hypothetical protein [Proteus mirabilis]MDF7334230.1 hypothetical protein [Proteus mirabilis]